jgi:Secretion system C-terminal sorting domain
MKTRTLVSIFWGLVFVSLGWSQYSFDLSCLSDTLQLVPPNGVANFYFRLTNTGSINDIYELDCQVIESIPGWFETFCLRGICLEPGVIRYDTLNAGQLDTTIHITVYTNLTQGREILCLKVRSLGDPTQKDSIRICTQVGQGIEEDPTTQNYLLLTPRIYPNPLKTGSTVNFTLNSLKGIIELKIYDVSGNMVKSFFTNPRSLIPIPCLIPLPSGSYIVTFTRNGKAILSKRMVLIK